ncbi:MAG: hypothetical protein Q8R63_06630 [Ramlibacter sp.]|nr:hypothetical protein [Ramlibacter sp.]
MKSAITTFRLRPVLSRDALVLAIISLPTLVLSSLDGCTRGPSVTSIVLANLGLFV